MSELKTNVMRILEASKIPFKVHTYSVGKDIDGISVSDKMGFSYDKVYKTLVTKGKSGEYFVFVLPVDKELDLKKAAKSVSEKSVEMIAVKDINKITGYIRGGCSPVGMKKLYKTVIHISAEKRHTFVISAGKIGYQVELNPLELSKLINAGFEDIIQ